MGDRVQSVLDTNQVTAGLTRQDSRLSIRASAADAAAAWNDVFQRFGLSLELVSAGCCGMAGTYGHEAKNLETSRRIFDLSWRAHFDQCLTDKVLATGYSCRSQVKRFSDPTALHPVQALLAEISSPSAAGAKFIKQSR
jgi:hypothetical protein